ncbi:MAG: site-specific DNA-methyltransferase [Propionivibrio sp.]|nr:site-specific DNA-methyltransferase [Propionivibrio sp.]
MSVPTEGRYWRFSKQYLDALIKKWSIGGERTESNARARFASCPRKTALFPGRWFYKDVGHTQEAKKELLDLVDFDTSDDVFITPKPTRLIQRILQIATDKDSLVLDSFAGSGTTGHAVLKQNVEDGGTRRFILVEMDENIARNVTAERVRRIAAGYTNAKGTTVEGLGGGFQFCRLSAEPLFTAEGQIRADVTFAQLAEFVWFAETGTGHAGNGDSPFLGVHEGRGIYLLYNGILKDKSIAGGNVLTGPVFDLLPKSAGPKVIYAAANRMGGRAADRHGAKPPLPAISPVDAVSGFVKPT